MDLLIFAKEYEEIYKFLKDREIDRMHFMIPNNIGVVDVPLFNNISNVTYDITDLKDEDNVINILKSKNLKHTKIIAIEELYLILAAKMRDLFDIPGYKYHQVEKFRSKFIMKKHLEKSGIKCPSFMLYNDKCDLKDFLEKYGKIVVKDEFGVGSMNTYVIEKHQDIDSVYSELKKHKSYQIEEFIEGTMYHCDSVIFENKILFTNIMKYLESTLSYKSGKHLRVVSEDNLELYKRIEIEAEKIIRQFNIINGVTHIELFVNDDGITFCEIAIRSGGGGIPEIVESLYGINLQKTDLFLQLGYGIDSPTKKTQHGAWYVIYPKEGQVKKISDVNEFQKFSWITNVKVYKSVGQESSHAMYSTHGIVIFCLVASSTAELIERCKIVENNFQIEYI